MLVSFSAISRFVFLTNATCIFFSRVRDLGILQADQYFSIVYISEPTESGTPIGLEWNEIRESGSVGDFGPFKSTIPVPSILHCVDVDCKIQNICGYYGTCIDDENGNGMCVCDDCYGGYFCQYNPKGSYAYEEYVAVNVYNEVHGNYYKEFWKGVEGCDPLLRPCRDGQTLLLVEVTPDEFPLETSWQLNVDQERFAGPFGAEDTPQKALCVPTNSCVEFIIEDLYGDGICCLLGIGGYKLFLNNTEIASGGEFNYTDSVIFLNCTQ